MNIGVLGGGQLARMLIEAGSRYGFDFHILSKEEDCPAGRITKFETVGDWNDINIVRTFSSQCDVITLENEFIDYHILECIEKSGKKILPGSETIRLIQDKLFQKQTLSRIGVPVAEYCEVASADDIRQFAESYGYPVILKTRTMGYDGKGNACIDDVSEIENAVRKLAERGRLMCERYIDFELEIATQAVRTKEGEVKVYPVVETIQEDHICKFVIASAGRFADLQPEVGSICKEILNSMSYVGVMGIEMFLTGGKILVNELAPRVHNSGHYTIEGCRTSQFENHVRAVSGLPLGPADMKCKAAVMINILGRSVGNVNDGGIDKVASFEDTYLHYYGKKESRPGRKLGHITVTGYNVSELMERAIRSRDELTV